MSDKYSTSSLKTSRRPSSWRQGSSAAAPELKHAGQGHLAAGERRGATVVRPSTPLGMTALESSDRDRVRAAAAR